jgi:NitT/TauT family transport system substrate-binding protein
VNTLSALLLCASVALSTLDCQGKPRTDPAPASGPSYVVAAAMPSAGAPTARGLPAGPLTIAYSDWPGWIAWDIAVERGFFRDAGVDVKLEWLEYVASMGAFSEGKVDSVCMTNGDALVSASGGAQGVGILLNDYSNGNDMIVARPGIETVAALKGKKIGVEVGFVDHLLLMEALKSASLTEADVQILNEKTQNTPELLRSGAVDAIAAWQPNSGQALEFVPGAKAIFTSASVPGLIYDLLFVAPKSLRERRSDWKKVVGVWFRVANYIADPKTRADAIRIMSARVKLAPAKFAALIGGTFILGSEGNRSHFANGVTFESVYGSTQAVDRFNVANHTYEAASDVNANLDPTLVAEIIAAH